ncbi:MAG: hypothetical protein H0U66_12515 [Gemmatimonadaceae bacterium]|nr:hypothetical protein [Gemmatimonadaceae bacterium]
MAGRIRTLKPEILDDAVTAGLSDMAFRLFVSVILLTEDSGRFRAEPGWLMGSVFWRRPVPAPEFAQALGDLVDARLIHLYGASGQRYGIVRNWNKHQRISHPATARLPEPPWGDGDPPDVLRSSSVHPPEDLRTSSALIPIPIPIPIPTPTPTTRLAEEASGSGTDEVWEHYVSVLKRHRPSRRPGKLSPTNRKKIATALKSFTVADLKVACSGLLRSPHHLGQNDRGTEYLEIEYALRKPAGMIALAEEARPSPMPPAPPPEELVDPAIIASFLAELDARYS